jgi:hypothetical protein
MSLDSDDLPSNYALHPLCQCGVQARQGVVPSKIGYGYICGNVVGEDDAWVSSQAEALISLLYVWSLSLMMVFVLNFSWQHTRMCDWEAFKGSRGIS